MNPGYQTIHIQSHSLRLYDKMKRESLIKMLYCAVYSSSDPRMPLPLVCVWVPLPLNRKPATSSIILPSPLASSKDLFLKCLMNRCVPLSGKGSKDQGASTGIIFWITEESIFIFLLSVWAANVPPLVPSNPPRLASAAVSLVFEAIKSLILFNTDASPYLFSIWSTLASPPGHPSAFSVRWGSAEPAEG